MRTLDDGAGGFDGRDRPAAGGAPRWPGDAPTDDRGCLYGKPHEFLGRVLCGNASKTPCWRKTQVQLIMVYGILCRKSLLHNAEDRS